MSFADCNDLPLLLNFLEDCDGLPPDIPRTVQSAVDLVLDAHADLLASLRRRSSSRKGDAATLLQRLTDPGGGMREVLDVDAALRADYTARRRMLLLRMDVTLGALRIGTSGNEKDAGPRPRDAPNVPDAATALAEEAGEDLGRFFRPSTRESGGEARAWAKLGDVPDRGGRTGDVRVDGTPGKRWVERRGGRQGVAERKRPREISAAVGDSARPVVAESSSQQGESRTDAMEVDRKTPLGEDSRSGGRTKGNRRAGRRKQQRLREKEKGGGDREKGGALQKNSNDDDGKIVESSVVGLEGALSVLRTANTDLSGDGR